MRSDMHKVLVEEPRHGGGPSKKNRRGNLPDELLPKFEGIKRPYTNRKWFGEHLGPLKRWLRSNVGRPWNDVYGEACDVIKGGNPVRTHIRFHMMHMIVRDTFMRDGEVWCYRYSQERPVISLRGYFVWPTFYVHPVTGILLAVPEKPRKRYPYRRGQADIHWINPVTALRQLNGCWFQCHFQPFPASTVRTLRHYDHAERKYLSEDEAHTIYGKGLRCIHKRQLSSRELKRLGLRNDPFPTDSAECASVRAYSPESTNQFGPDQQPSCTSRNASAYRLVRNAIENRSNGDYRFENLNWTCGIDCWRASAAQTRPARMSNHSPAAGEWCPAAGPLI